MNSKNIKQHDPKVTFDFAMRDEDENRESPANDPPRMVDPKISIREEFVPTTTLLDCDPSLFTIQWKSYTNIKVPLT